MFTILDKKKNWYQFLFSGNDLSDWFAYHKALYDIPPTERISDSGTHWIQEKAIENLLQTKTQLKLTPYAYQQEAVDFILEKQSGLMLLPCGSGKSFVIIGAYAHALKEQLVQTPGLIVVKASLKLQWREEIKKFSYLTPHIIETKAQLCAKELTKLKKTKNETERAILTTLIATKFEKQFFGKDLFIANYETLNDDDVRSALRKQKLDFVAADEIQYIKSYKAKRSLSLGEFKTAKIKIGASATPIQKDYCDAFGIFSFLVPMLFKNFSTFASHYVRYGGFGKIIGFKNTDTLMIKLKPYLFIKTEEDIASQMPDLLPPIQLWCDLDAKAEMMTAQIFEELQNLRLQEKAVYAKFTCETDYLNSQERLQIEGKIMALQTFAQELADAPELLEHTDSAMAKHYCLTGRYTNPKLDLLIEQASSIIESGEKVIIFSKFERIQSILEARLKKAFSTLKIAKVHGGLSPEQRYEQANVLFKDDEACQVLLASNAIAEGFSAYWCKYLIEYDLADSYAVQTQRHGRIRRANSMHQTLYVYQILARKSYDEVALKIVSKKEAIDAELKTT